MEWVLFSGFISRISVLQSAIMLSAILLLGFLGQYLNVAGLFLITVSAIGVAASASQYGLISRKGLSRFLSDFRPKRFQPRSAIPCDSVIRSSDGNAVRFMNKASRCVGDSSDGDEQYCRENVGEEVDAESLRGMVERERRRADAACSELEKEREASASAAEEAMAMITRLQIEKGGIQMEADQFRAMAQHKHSHEQRVISLLRDKVKALEYETTLLADQLGLSGISVRQHARSDDGDGDEDGDGHAVNDRIGH